MSKASLSLPPLTGIQDRNVQSALQSIANWARAINEDYVSKDELKLPKATASTPAPTFDSLTLDEVRSYLQSTTATSPAAIGAVDTKNLAVNGLAVFNGSTVVKGWSTFEKAITVTGGASISGNLTVSSGASISGNLTISNGRIYWHNEQDGNNYDLVDLIARCLAALGML